MSEMNYHRPEFSGRCFGVDLSVPVSGTPVIFEVSIEDDEYWHRRLLASSFWLDDLIEQLQKVKSALQDESKFAKNPNGYGYIFK